MSLFSKLLGGNNADKSPLDLLKNAAGAVLSEAEKAAENAKKSQQAAPAAQPRRDSRADAAGVSWGGAIPAEENQYNFNGTYVQYFSKVFREDFPAYDVRQESGRDAKSPLFVFYRDGAKQLVVELKSERSSAQAIRRQCEAEGTPYLRFYYDHDGWWNTRSYVTGRVRGALG
jgi:hypothetical protein